MPEETVAGTPADPTLEFTPLTLKVKRETKNYKLIYDFDSIAKAEEITDMPLLIGVNWRRIGVKQIQAMLYASMVKAQPDITMAEIKSLITVPNVPVIERALAQAWISSHAEEDEEAKPEETPNPPQPEPAQPSEN